MSVVPNYRNIKKFGKNGKKTCLYVHTAARERGTGLRGWHGWGEGEGGGPPARNSLYCTVCIDARERGSQRMEWLGGGGGPL